MTSAGLQSSLVAAARQQGRRGVAPCFKPSVAHRSRTNDDESRSIRAAARNHSRALAPLSPFFNMDLVDPLLEGMFRGPQGLATRNMRSMPIDVVEVRIFKLSSGRVGAMLSVA
jgi:hypothetical protein